VQNKGVAAAATNLGAHAVDRIADAAPEPENAWHHMLYLASALALHLKMSIITLLQQTSSPRESDTLLQLKRKV
jgi:hypothetical protein